MVAGVSERAALGKTCGTVRLSGTRGQKKMVTVGSNLLCTELAGMAPVDNLRITVGRGVEGGFLFGSFQNVTDERFTE